LQSGRRRTGPLEAEIPSDIFQSVGERRKINSGEDKGKKVHRSLDSGRRRRIFLRSAITVAHLFQKNGFITAVMDKSRIRDRQKDAKEFNPYPLFFVLVIGPKGVVNGAIACSDANADQVVKIAIWQ